MNKREFIKTGLVGVVGLASIPTIARNTIVKSTNIAKIPKLPGDFSSYANFLSSKALKAHYEIFVASADELNLDLNHHLSDINGVKDILLNSHKFGSGIIRNSNTYLNHKIFFKSISPVTSQPTKGNLLTEIENSFGSFESFKTEFEETALASRHGKDSWVWLVYKNNKLIISPTENDNNPFSSMLPEEKRGYPILGIDLWEHAYYIDYEYNVEAYIKSFLNHIDWNYVNKRYNRALHSKI